MVDIHKYMEINQFVDSSIQVDDIYRYKNIPITIDGVTRTLHGLTEGQAKIQFNNNTKAIKKAISNYLSYEIPKHILVTRLQEANLFKIAIDKLNASDLGGVNEGYNYHLFMSYSYVKSNDIALRFFLKHIGGDLTTLLAKP